jgi:hypothetical protein
MCLYISSLKTYERPQKREALSASKTHMPPIVIQGRSRGYRQIFSLHTK